MYKAKHLYKFLLTISLFIVIVCQKSFSEPASYDDAVKIAQTMRECQARYEYIKDVCYNWIDVSCGDISTPNYPPDNFFVSVLLESDGKETAADLVADAANCFWAIFDEFVQDDYWPSPTKIETKEDGPQNYDSDDFPALFPEYIPYYITDSNYRDALDLYYDAIINKLKYIDVRVITEDVETEASSGCAVPGYEFPPCADCSDLLEDCCGAAKENYSWDGAWDDNVGSRGISKGTSIFLVPQGFSAGKTATRFKLCSEISKYVNTAEATSYVRITPPTCDYGDGDCWSDTEMDNLEDRETWQKWGADPLTGWTTYSEDPNYKISGYLANYEPSDNEWICATAPLWDNTTHGWYFIDSVVILEPDFDTSEDDLGSDGSVDVDYFNKESNLVYSANSECDQSNTGEVVDGNVIGPSAYVAATSDDRAVKVTLEEDYSLQSVKLYIDKIESTGQSGWNGTGTALTSTQQQLCYPDSNGIRFSVKSLKMADGQKINIKFKVEFWRETSGGDIKKSEQIVTMQVKPNPGNICCNEDSCKLITIKTAKAEEGLFCGYRDTPKIAEQDNGDFDVFLPDYKEGYFIIDTPKAGFLNGWGLEKDGNKATIFYSSGGKRWYFAKNSPYKLMAIQNIDDVNIVEFEYDGYDRLIKQVDASNSAYYIEYDYNDVGGISENPEFIIAQANDVNRIYEPVYDESNRIIAVNNTDCGCSGGSGYIKYEFYSNDLKKYEKNYDDQIIYHYIYDSNERLTGKYLGDQSSNNPIIKNVFNDLPDGNYIKDVYSYIDDTNYIVVREYHDSAGNLTKKMTFDYLNEDPVNPIGDIFTEHYLYEYDSNDTLVRKVFIPAIADVDDPDIESLSGIVRKEYIYDANTGDILIEEWYRSNDSNYVIVSNSYDYIYNGGEIINSRINTMTGARGAVTDYDYADSDDTIPNLKKMPEVSDGVSGTLQLQYSYVYDNLNRVEYEKQLNNSSQLITQVKYVYDSFGNLQYRYDDYQGSDEQVTEYVYNGFGDLLKTILSSGVVTGNIYYDNGRLESEVIYDPADDDYVYSKTKYEYDDNGRVEYIHKAAKYTDKFATDTEPDQPNWITTKYEYDLQGNKTKVIEDLYGLALETSYEYDNQGQLIKTTLPNGKWTKTVFDGRGLVRKQIVGYGQGVSEVEYAVTEFKYDANGNLIEQKAPDLTKTLYEYDNFDRVKKITRGI